LYSDFQEKAIRNIGWGIKIDGWVEGFSNPDAKVIFAFNTIPSEHW